MIGRISQNLDKHSLNKAGKISKAEGHRFSPKLQTLDMNLKGIFFRN